jgi:hypothetical protein
VKKFRRQLQCTYLQKQNLWSRHGTTEPCWCTSGTQRLLVRRAIQLCFLDYLKLQQGEAYYYVTVAKHIKHTWFLWIMWSLLDYINNAK